MENEPWQRIAAQQQGLIARRQLRQFGVHWPYVRTQLAAGRWSERTNRVVSTFTGPLTLRAVQWLGVLHAGGASLIGGLSATAVHGLSHWDRDVITVLVDDERTFEPVAGVRFVRTRRPLLAMRDPGSALPLCRVEPAALLFAGYVSATSTAVGLLAAVVQQRLSTPAAMTKWIGAMQPLRRSRLLRDALADIADGAESWNELRFNRLCHRFGLASPRRQTRHRGPSGRGMRTDCEWETADGTTVVLEIDGPFHMEVAHWSDDLARQRQLVTPGRIQVRCTTLELRTNPGRVMADLRRLGVPLEANRPSPPSGS